jgi:hypothetical protein
MKRGPLRLSIVAAATIAAGTLYVEALGHDAAWRELDRVRLYMCGNAPGARPADLLQCNRDAPGNRAPVQVNHLSPPAYWAQAATISLIIDLILATLVVEAVWLSRWIANGFRFDRDRAAASVEKSNQRAHAVSSREEHRATSPEGGIPHRAGHAQAAVPGATK